jgi:hypothetical protein
MTNIDTTYINYCNPNLELTIKARACKVAGQKGSLRMKESVREWTLTLPRELSFWELQSQRTPKFLKSNYRDQNPLDQNVIYTIENFLECRCLKWAHITHLDI